MNRQKQSSEGVLKNKRSLKISQNSEDNTFATVSFDKVVGQACRFFTVDFAKF